MTAANHEWLNLLLWRNGRKLIVSEGGGGSGSTIVRAGETWKEVAAGVAPDGGMSF
jgi:hypothetical protein